MAQFMARECWVLAAVLAAVWEGESRSDHESIPAPGSHLAPTPALFGELVPLPERGPAFGKRGPKGYRLVGSEDRAEWLCSVRRRQRLPGPPAEERRPAPNERPLS